MSGIYLKLCDGFIVIFLAESIGDKNYCVVQNYVVQTHGITSINNSMYVI